MPSRRICRDAGATRGNAPPRKTPFSSKSLIMINNLAPEPDRPIGLLRCKSFGPSEKALLDELREAAQFAFFAVVDGRFLTSGGSSVLVSDANAAAELGIYAPPDITWRCGDYCLYVASRKFPDAPEIWMIEPDVRISGPVEKFFRFFEPVRTDLLVADLRPATSTWYWTDCARGAGIKPWRCFFPVSRFSKKAIISMYETRRRHSQILLRRKLWGNDESFVATHLVNNGFYCRDFNSFGEIFYDNLEYNYNTVALESEVLATKTVRLHHPVLSEEARIRKQERSRSELEGLALSRRLIRRGAALVLGRTKW